MGSWPEASLTVRSHACYRGANLVDGTGSSIERVRRIHGALGRPAVGLLVNAAAVLSVVAFGLIGVGRVADRSLPLHADTQFLYVAGRMWLVGKNPYILSDFRDTCHSIPGLAEDFLRSGFCYFPTASPWCVLLGLFSLTGAEWVINIINCIAVAILAYFVVKIVSQNVSDERTNSSLRWIVPAIVVGNPYTAHIVFEGQTTLVVSAALAAGWYYTYYDRRPIEAGILFAIASAKPQIAMVVVAWVVLVEHDWKQITASAVAALLLSALPLWESGPVGAMQQWLASLKPYQSVDSNSLGFPNVFGIPSLLAASGVHPPGLSLLVIPATVLLWWYRSRLSPEYLLAVLLGESFLLVYAHDYDLAALAIFFACVWKKGTGSVQRCVAALVFFALIFAPQRYVRHSHFAPVVHWREIVLLAYAVWLAIDRDRDRDVAELSAK